MKRYDVEKQNLQSPEYPNSPSGAVNEPGSVLNATPDDESGKPVTIADFSRNPATVNRTDQVSRVEGLNNARQNFSLTKIAPADSTHIGMKKHLKKLEVQDTAPQIPKDMRRDIQLGNKQLENKNLTTEIPANDAPVPKVVDEQESSKNLHYDIVKTLLSKLGKKILADASSGKVLIYQKENGIHASYDKNNFLMFLQDFYQGNPEVLPKISSTTANEVFKRILYTSSIQKRYDSFEPNRHLLCLEDCVVDCTNGERMEFHHRYFHLRKVPVDYTHDRNPQEFLRILDRTFGNEEDKELFLEVMAYLVSGFLGAKLAFVFVGEKDSSKSMFMRLISRFYPLGVENLSLSDLCNSDKNLKGTALDARLICADEEEKIPIRKTATIKTIISNGDLHGDKKYVQGKSGQCKSKLLICTNNMIEISEKVVDTAILDRFLFVPFDIRVPREDWILDLDQKLFERERDQIFDLLLEYMQKIYRNKFVFTQTKRSTELRREFWSIECEFVEYLNECCVIAPGEAVRKGELWQNYLSWCKSSYTKALPEKIFRSKVVEITGVHNEKTRVLIDHATGEKSVNPVSAYCGIGLKL